MEYKLTDALWTLTHQYMSSYLIPFFTLSYQKDTPVHPDSFKDSSYYGTGPLDLCLIVTIIAVMAILRDAFRLCLFEPLARWVLTRRLERSRKQGTEAKNNPPQPIANGNGHLHDDPCLQKERRRTHRSVLRFAEQGWSFVYYTAQWSFGFVRPCAIRWADDH